jgi:hypothetical protein
MHGLKNRPSAKSIEGKAMPVRDAGAGLTRLDIDGIEKRGSLAPRTPESRNVEMVAARNRSREALARVALLLSCLLAGCALLPASGSRIFRISVVDAETGRGIPAVELRTTDSRSFFTDSAGTIALREPDLENQMVFFQILSFGYRFEQEVLGMRGTALRVEPGKSTLLQMQRENVAERLYRVTGPGIYRDSMLVGDSIPYRPRLTGTIPTGMDTVFATTYRDKLFWVWGDTWVLSRPLGNFRASGALSQLPERGGVDPQIGVALRYFRSGAEIRPMIEDQHPVIWLTGLRATRDAAREERLFATYLKIVDGMRTVERGLAEYDDESQVFRIAQPYPSDAPIAPEGHAFRYVENGVPYIQYDLDVRSRDDAAAVRDRTSYEAFTPLRSGSRLSEGASAFERDASGHLVWGWKRDTQPVPVTDWDELVKRGVVAPREALYRLVDIETGRTVVPHNGSIQWNAFRRRWVMIRTESGGDSFLGEVYYFEGDTPLGPWAYGRKIVTHARTLPGPDGKPLRETYTFYNPMQHPEFDRAGGREIFFEGTLATTFAAPPAPRIPSYDYNQMMYKLYLEDPRVVLPVPVYRLPGDPPAYRTRDALLDGRAAEQVVRIPARVAFFAPDRPREGSIAIREVTQRGEPRLVAGEAGDTSRPQFYCASSELPAPPATVPLYEHRDSRGHFLYSTDAGGGSDPVLCHVWPAPVDYDDALLPRS